MPVAELPFRVSEQVERRRARHVALAVRPELGDRVDTSLAEIVLSWGERAGAGAYWAQRAAAVARGEVVIFDERWPSTSDGLPDWDLDALTSFRWPQDYCFDVPLVPASDPPVEVKYVWELNRLLYLLPVAAQAATQQDEELSQLCRRHLENWISTHPPRRGVAWKSGIELAHRLLVVVVVLELTSAVQAPDPGLERLVARTVADHVDWIRRFPSRFSSANNHRVTELVGLLLAAAAYPALADATEVDGWWAEFASVVTAQFHEDGVTAEQATMYAFQVLEWVAVGLRAGRRQGRFPPAALSDRVYRAAHFLADVIDAGAHAVRIGDDDDSRLLTEALPRSDMPAAVLELVSAELGRPTPLAGTGLTTYVDGGYTVWRSGSPTEEILWVLDHAPLGMGHLSAHAHADTLAVFLHIGGRPVLVDAGTYLYHSGGTWRDHFRQTAEHNTLAVEGQDSSLIAGAFSWRRSPRAEGRLISTTASADRWSVEAEHHGYVRRFGVVHRRLLEGLEPRSFRLTDRLGGRVGRRIRWSVLLAPGLEVARTSDGWVVSETGTELLRLTVPPQWRASSSEEEAWYSPAFGGMEKTRRLVIDGDLDPVSDLTVEFTVPV